jgi:hypothetical protein
MIPSADDYLLLRKKKTVSNKKNVAFSLRDLRFVLNTVPVADNNLKSKFT